MSLMYGDSADVGPIEYYEYEGYYPGSACAQIRDRDPQGFEHEPTEADIANHRQWAIDTLGLEQWQSYSGEGREEIDREPGQ